MDFIKEYEFWRDNPYFDEETREELKGISDRSEEIEERFYKNLEFGTGGLRGIIGAGTNRMNIYTVRKATQGLADFIIRENAQKKGVAIAYDSRRMSPEFAKEAALCLAANGIYAYLFESLRPTPMLSFAVRKLGCVAGIVVTASHNPPEYNGYKVYWEDGAQVTAPKDKQIITCVNQITDFSAVKTMPEEKAREEELLAIIGKEVDDAYIEELKRLVLRPEAISSAGKRLKIVYTPLHGTGNIPVRRILKELGLEHVYVVPEQEMPDGDFPTVSYPNPEDEKAFQLALKLAEKVDADLVLATDPDADRLGAYVKDSVTGCYQPLTGNMSGILICEYLLSQKKQMGILPENGAVVTTIVSTNMAGVVAKEYGQKLVETLTGFKYIGEQIKLFEQNGNGDDIYQFGFEESYGCLEGTHARDKDAVVAVMALCEAAAYYAVQGKTLWDQMKEIFEKYGYYKEGLYTRTLKGIDGNKQIQRIMEALRANPPEKIGDYQVTEFRDYGYNRKKDMKTGCETDAGLPISNVLYFALDQEAWCCVRPSGTEPKIKFYMGVKGNSMEEATGQLRGLTEAAKKLGEF